MSPGWSGGGPGPGGVDGGGGGPAGQRAVGALGVIAGGEGVQEGLELDAATGKLLRELTLDPSRNYQPTGKPHSPRPETP